MTEHEGQRSNDATVEMKPIIHLKDGIFGNAVTIIFLLGLAWLSVWLDHKFNSEVRLIAWIFAGIFTLACYFPMDEIRRPKCRTLAIDGHLLVWRSREGRDGETQETKLPLGQIRALEFLVPREGGAACAELFFVDIHGNRHALPMEFFPGVYRDQIVSAVRQRVPALKVMEIDR